MDKLGKNCYCGCCISTNTAYAIAHVFDSNKGKL